jgi:dolichol-phosphate mannosyltransferase
LPTYREADNISALLSDIRDALADRAGRWEVLVVDDSSPDGTYERAAAMAATDSRFRAQQRRERGLATAVLHGIRSSTSDAVVVMDSDYNHDPRRLPELIQLLDYYDVVIGSRFVMGGGMAERRRYYFSFAYNLFVRLVLRTQVQDNLSGFFAIHRRHLDALPAERVFQGYGDYFIRLLLYAYRQGWRLLEIPVVYQIRLGGQSKSNLMSMVLGYTRTVLELRFSGA